LAALERIASAVFFTENRIECNAPTSTMAKQGPGWADVWQSALRAWHQWLFLPVSFLLSQLASGKSAARDDKGEIGASIRISCWLGELQIPPLPPDFLSGLVALANFMRLSSMKAAYVVFGGAA